MKLLPDTQGFHPCLDDPALPPSALASSLPVHHKDPMDRFLVAQALVDDMAIVTLDTAFRNYEAKTLW